MQKGHYGANSKPYSINPYPIESTLSAYSASSTSSSASLPGALPSG